LVKNRGTNMRAMGAETFNGYKELKLIDLPKPALSDGKVMVRITAAGVTPLDHTILSGQFHHSKAPLVLAMKERAWWRREADPTFPPAHA
jgi:NADPH:quinone reductase-like Zn-dependent oxidoreductase